MKKFIVFVSILILTSAAARALPWEGEYELAGLNLNMKEYKFGKNSRLGNLCASESGCLSPSLEQKEFEKEVLKLGRIIKSNIKKD